jgi:hypothetical protein
MSAPVEEKETTVAHHDATLREADNAVQLAHEVDDTVYSPWSAGLFKLYAVLIIPYLCGCLNGYDGSLMGGIIIMDSYQAVFNM